MPCCARYNYNTLGIKSKEAMDKAAKIAVLGYGMEGESIVQYLFKSGYKSVVVHDLKPNLENLNNVQKCLGKDYLNSLEKYDIIFRSPGIPYLSKEFKNLKAKLTSSTKYFFENCPAPIIGVTGTKGKGTTASLIAEILKQDGKKVWLGGNIGLPAISFLDEVKKEDYVVLELSSFQLQDLEKSPRIAVLLMTTTEHLDHHKSTKEYRDSKKSIIKYQKPNDFAVINIMHNGYGEFLKEVKANLYTIDTNKIQKNGSFVQNGVFTIAINDNLHKICPVKNTKLIGKHNWENICAAAMATYLSGVKINSIAKGISSFEGLPHRLQKIAEIEGITYINDSFSTAPEPTIAAIKSFDKPIILIIGGSEKGHEYTELAVEIVKNKQIKKIIFLGHTAANKMKLAIEKENNKQTKIIEKMEKEGKKSGINKNVPLVMAQVNSLAEAFLSIKISAKAGDVVLFSPAAASLDLFKNYKDRGNQFIKAVEEITQLDINKK